MIHPDDIFIEDINDSIFYNTMFESGYGDSIDILTGENERAKYLEELEMEENLDD